MNLNRKSNDVDMKLQVAALIDVVFLLLIYFMVTASLIQREGDLAFKLPAPSEHPLKDVPIELLIDIQADGVVALDGVRFESSDEALSGMARQISGLKQIALSQGAPLVVNLRPSKEATHTRVIDVMDACSKAGVETLAFAHSI